MIPPIFNTIQEDGGIPRDEMYRVFNMGLGMVLVCDPSEVDQVIRSVPDSMIVGDVTGNAGSEQVVLQS
jgi:phosphoribosylformylglycinamidine cyclo-ligase